MELEGLKYNLNCNAADNLVKNIRGMIFSGKIKPGYEFPNEKEFCEQLGVSRSTLREAFKVLEATGYIKRVKGHGTVVKEISGIMVSAPLKDSMHFAEMSELMEFREMIETELAKLAAIRATDEQIARLEELLTRMQNTTDLVEEFSIHDANFHFEIAFASRNTLMIAVMKNMQSLITSAVYTAFQIDTTQNIQEALESHTQILEAIKAHDPESAVENMRKHIQKVSKRVFEKENKENQ